MAHIRFANPVIFVSDVAASTRFYSDLLGLKVVEDAGAFVLFEDHFSIHQAEPLLETIFGQPPVRREEAWGQDNLLLYCESDDVDAMYERIQDHVSIIHPVKTMFWGQRVFRFRDPDGHIVEIGEPQVYTFGDPA